MIGVQEVDRTAPEKIWLCVSDELDDASEPFPHDKEDVCWADDAALTVSVPYIRADIHAAEVERLNKALEQALRYEEWVYSDEKRCPELAAWLKENRS